MRSQAVKPRSTRPPSTATADLARPALTTTHGILFQADCLELLARIRSESIHCVFADPPFNLKKNYGNGFHDAWEEDRAYLNWCYRWIDECCRVLVPGGALFIYALPRLAYMFAAHITPAMRFRHWIALSMKGTYPRGRKLYPAHYALLYFTKGEPRVYNRVRVPVPSCRHCGRDVKDYGGHRKALNPAGLTLTDFWDDTSPNRHKGSKARPGINELKPMIPARAIRIATDPSGTALRLLSHDRPGPKCVPEIADRKFYNGAEQRIARLGLTPLWKELESILTGFDLRVEEKKNANGGAAVREKIDEAFTQAAGWTRTPSLGRRLPPRGSGRRRGNRRRAGDLTRDWRGWRPARRHKTERASPVSVHRFY